MVNGTIDSDLWPTYSEELLKRMSTELLQLHDGMYNYISSVSPGSKGLRARGKVVC